MFGGGRVSYTVPDPAGKRCDLAHDTELPCLFVTIVYIVLTTEIAWVG